MEHVLQYVIPIVRVAALLEGVGNVTALAGLDTYLLRPIRALVSLDNSSVIFSQWQY